MSPTQKTTTTASDSPSADERVTRVSTPTTEQVARTARTVSGDQTTLVKTRIIEPSAAAKEDYRRKKTVFQAYQVIWYILTFIEIVLIFRFALKFLGANPDNGFAQFVYGLSFPFAGPFLGLFAEPVAGQSVFEWSTLIAMVVWWLVGWGLTKLFQLYKPVSSEEIEQTMEQE